MTVEFEDFLKLYTYHDNVQSFFFEFEHQNKEDFRFGKKSSTTHDAYLLSKNIQTRFQYSCMDIARMTCANKEAKDEINQDNKKEAILKDLISNVAYILDNQARISNFANFTSKELAQQVVEKIFTPLCDATEELGIHLIPKHHLPSLD